MAVSCTMTEVSSPDDSDLFPLGEHAYFATISDQPNEIETKTYSDEDLRVCWKYDDRVTVFEDVLDALELKFAGEDGRTGGPFDYVEGSGGGHAYYGGSELGEMKYAIYPHSTDTKISRINKENIISYTLPGTQYYREKSFGEGANVMVAETGASSKILKFKNLGGYLSFYLYGTGVSVSYVKLKSRNGEPLSGPGTIKMVIGLPEIKMSQGASDEVVLECKDAVALGETAETATEFRFVLPPLTFSDLGFTITVGTADGGIFTMDGPMSFSVERNKVLGVFPLEVSSDGLGSDISIKEISSNAGGYGVQGKLGAKYKNKATYDATNQSFDITLPTVTDFSAQKFNFTLAQSSDVLLVDGEVVESGVTPIDASSPVTLTVRRGEREKKFTLNAHNTGLPVVRITMEGDGFTLAKLESYKNSLQSSDKLDHRVWLPDPEDESQAGWSASVRIEKPDGTPGMDNGTLFEAETQIKGRGNYTWKWDKKPYALKFSDDFEVDILGMPKHTRWVLLANWRDRTLLRNDAAFWLSEQSAPEIPYTVKGQFVELEVNGEHRGNYYLCEQIKINKKRVNITKFKKDFTDLTGGYLMEIDSYWDELNKFKSKGFNLRYMFKEPDDDPNDPENIDAASYAEGYAWMEDFINRFEKSLKTKADVEAGEYTKYLDVPSAIMFMLLNELTGNKDFFQDANDEVLGPHSTYLYKDKKDEDGNESKLFMGPIWDFDYKTFTPKSDYGRDFTWRGFDKHGYYYYFLCHDDDFVNEIKRLWGSKVEAFQGLPAHITDMVTLIAPSQKFDETLWPFKYEENRNDNGDYTLSFSAAIQRMISSFNDRISWMNLQILGDSQNPTVHPGLKPTTPKDSEWGVNY